MSHHPPIRLPAILVAALAPALAAGAERPNILLILADDFGHELVGASGGESYRTPAIDRLAGRGVRFEHCHAQPLCTPTRVQLLTGLSNRRNYVRFGELAPGSVTFAQILRDAGYRTGIAGKWQLGGGFEAPRRFGFDEHLLWQLTTRGSRYANPVLEADGKVLEPAAGKYGPDVLSDFAVDFMRRHRDRPFCLLYSMVLTHAPFEPTPESKDWDPRRPAGDRRSDPRHFPDMVAHADKVVGKLVAAVDALGLGERTLVIFTGDNGTGRAIRSRFSGREVQGGKGTTTDAGTHVPLIARWTGTGKEGRVCRDLVDSTDLFATLLDAAGAAPPPGLTPDGRSFLPQVRGEAGAPRPWLYSWYAPDGGPEAREWARTHRFKLYGDGTLYDLASDPLEVRQLSDADLTADALAARETLDAVLRSFRSIRRAPPEAAAATTAPRGEAGEAARRIEALGGRVFRKDDRVVEVILDGREEAAEILRAAADLPDLTDLSLERTAIGDAELRPVLGLPRLEWLNLYRTRIGDVALEGLAGVSSLKMLPVGETRVTDAGLAHLQRLPRLEYLGLRGNRITDKGIAQVAKLTALTGLHLGDTQVSDAGIALLPALTRLEKLWLDGTAVSDVAVASLGRLASLRELHVAGTKLTAKGLASLQAALPECSIETER